MNALLDVIVPGKPGGAMRPRAVKRGNHAGVHMADKHVHAEGFAVDRFERAWAEQGGRLPLDEPITLHITAVNPRPAALCKPTTKRSAGSPVGRIPCPQKADWDNIGKLISDALTKAGVLVDDKIVCTGIVHTLYVSLEPPEQPHVRVQVFRWTAPS